MTEPMTPIKFLDANKAHAIDKYLNMPIELPKRQFVTSARDNKSSSGKKTHLKKVFKQSRHKKSQSVMEEVIKGGNPLLNEAATRNSIEQLQTLTFYNDGSK